MHIFQGKISQVSWMRWFLASSLIPSPKSHSPKRQKPSSQHSRKLLRLPLKSCHISALLFVPSAWYPFRAAMMTGKLEDIFRNICITSQVELWSFRSWQLKFTFKQHRGSNHMAFKRGQGWTASISLLQFSYYHPKSTSTIHPGPRKEGRKEDRKGGRNHPGLQFRKKCLSFKNSPNKKSNITPKTSNPTQNPPMLGLFIPSSSQNPGFWHAAF